MKIRQKREIKGIQIGKKSKCPYLHILCSYIIKDPKDSTRHFIQFINTLNKVGEDKINTRKAVAFLLQTSILRKKSGKLFHFQQPQKYPEINLTKEMEDLYNEKLKALTKIVCFDMIFQPAWPDILSRTARQFGRFPG